jgi:hypothetical protein
VSCLGLSADSEKARRLYLDKNAARKLRREARQELSAQVAPKRKPQTTVFPILRADDPLLKNASTGAKLRAARERSGRPKQPERDKKMAEEFYRRRKASPKSVSNTKLMIDIGRQFGLGRSTAIEIIKGEFRKLASSQS